MKQWMISFFLSFMLIYMICNDNISNKVLFLFFWKFSPGKRHLQNNYVGTSCSLYTTNNKLA
ncbi:hypothetical protein BDA99DRAFT_495725 [Phascolomyces articulosus]|uniref:Uncharacterized protein n=1 Tax=Phascolomyces articulosus TaxID=60185 RepID=A0AAD5K9H9_9FUNG|nr:hypothetical protein BDA99DRAFT_495725 [Phascolomyces articulosus]